MPLEQPSRANDAAGKLKEGLSKFETEEGRLAGLSYKPTTKDEVAITTTPKAGTTWLQQICHQLRSAPFGGDMSFSEISEIVPWLELAFDQGQDLSAPQYGDEQAIPRIFKTHAWEEHCPKFDKTIVVLRDPKDVLRSFYSFFEGWFFEPGEISLDDFADDFWLARGVPTSRMQNASYFVHLISWYKRREDPTVLFVFFEDLKEDLVTEVTRIASFISTDKHNFSTKECIDLAVKRSTYEFMKEHDTYFDEKLSKLARNPACGLKPDAGMNKTKIVNGETGHGKLILSDELQEKIQKKWNEVVLPVTGCATYEELRAKFKNTRN